MKLTEIDHQAIVRTIALQANSFRTKEVSQHPIMLAAHPSHQSTPGYNPTVGKYLRLNATELGIRYECEGNGAGAFWSKIAATPEQAAFATSTQLRRLSEDEISLGPQYGGDGAFTARMRFHQSHFRATVLRVPCGTGPTADRTSCFGNMLRPEDGKRGLNFVTADVFEAACARLAQGKDRVEPFRLLHNMLSSQPLCFNIFGPLVGRPERATRLFSALFPGEIAHVRDVRIEYSPEPVADYLSDGTSFDAFVDYDRSDGTRALIGIETKLTDEFSQELYDGQRYRRWMGGARCPFRSEAHDRVQQPAMNQLWRNHLLALALRDADNSPYRFARSLVVHHPLDRSGAGAIAGYRELLKETDDTFGAMTLENVVTSFETAATDDEEKVWLATFRRRYLDLDASEIAWRKR